MNIQTRTQEKNQHITNTTIATSCRASAEVHRIQYEMLSQCWFMDKVISVQDFMSTIHHKFLQTT